MSGAVQAEAAPVTPAPSAGASETRVANRHPWLVLEAAVLGLALLYSLVFWARLPTQLPSDVDYAALAAVLHTEALPGDAVAVLPFWADRVRTMVRGTPVIGLPNLETDADVERYARLWVVAQPALPRSDARETLQMLSSRLDLQGQPRRFGPLELWRFAPKAGRAATWDFAAHPGEAQVQSNGPVQLQWREFDFLPRHCFLLGGDQADLRFPAVALVHGLRVGLGVAQGGAAQVTPIVDGRPLSPIERSGSGPAFASHEIPVDGLTPGDHLVEFQVRGRGACLDPVAY